MHLWPQSRGWRVALIGSGLLALGTGSLLGYWILEGKRRLRTELEALRASGAPEFPEQIVFQPRVAGADAVAWWRSIESKGVAWSPETLPECAGRLPLGDRDYEIQLGLAAALVDPRRVGSISPCEQALLRLRVEADQLALELALQVESIAPYDWRSDYEDADRPLEKLMSMPWIAGCLASIRLLCARAVLSAVDGKIDEARGSLMLAYRAIDRIGEPPNCLAYQIRLFGLRTWLLGGFLPMLHLLPADADWSEVDSLLERVDLPSQFRWAIEGERALGNAYYRAIRGADGLEPTVLPAGVAEAEFTRVFLGRDQATYLKLMRRALETAGGKADFDAWHDYEAELDAAAGSRRLMIDGLIWVLMIPRLSVTGREVLSTQTKLHLLRAAIRARREGADAAIAWLAQYRDPFDGKALRSRLDPDGVLNLWSVGEDGQDDPPQAGREQHEQLDDILVQVRVP